MITLINNYLYKDMHNIYISLYKNGDIGPEFEMEKPGLRAA